MRRIAWIFDSAGALILWAGIVWLLVHFDAPWWAAILIVLGLRVLWLVARIERKINELADGFVAALFANEEDTK